MPSITRRAIGQRFWAAGAVMACLASGLAAAPAGPSPASSLSATTRAVIANLVSNVDFLDRSSRFALDHSKNRRLRAFARAEAREQSAAIDALWDWTQRQRAPDPKLLTASAARPDAAKPALDTTPTGSVRAAWPAAPSITEKSGTDLPLAKGQEELDSLEGLEGPAFDADYKAAQREALDQVAADYAALLAKGEESTLLALARRELPKVQLRLKAMARL